MAYRFKTIEEFQNYLNIYLEKHPIEASYEETLINNFSSSNLSDLYKLFLDLRNIELTENSYIILRDILQRNFGINPDLIFPINAETVYPHPISSESKRSLENFIKDKFLENISDKKIDENEFYRLSLIVNKIFPNVFLNLVQNKTSDISKQQAFINKKFLETTAHYYSHSTKDAQQENADIAASLRMTARKLYPHLDIYIPGRIKSMKSAVSNIEKEFEKSLLNIVPCDLTAGISDEDVEKQFSLDSANTDFTGLTVVLANTDDVLHFDENDPRTPELLQLRKERAKNINFIHDIDNVLSQDIDTEFSDIKLLQIKIELLTRLRECTYSECTQEFQGTSFVKLLEKSITEYNELIKNPSNSQLENDEFIYLIKLDEIETLLEELKKRVHDKYQSKILEIVMPEILSDESLVETLKIKSTFIKSVKKPNGFCSTYYSLETLEGRKIELQVQSKMRFQDSKDGTSDHSKLPNKTIDISPFFEPVDSELDNVQYESLLNLLNTTPVATKNVLYQTQDSQLGPREKRLKRKLKIAEQNIKLKDSIKFEYVDKDGTQKISTVPIEQYLPSFAGYVSPKLFSVSSHHTRFNKTVVSYSKKSLLSCFTEVLLKTDSTTCLAQQLIDKLEEITPNDKNEVSLNGISRRAKLRQKKQQESDYLEL